MSTCLVCGQPSPDSFICEGDLIRTHNRLTELQGLNSELHTALTRMVRMTELSDGGRSAEKALVFNARAAETIRLIRATLVSWVRELAGDTGTPLPLIVTVTSLTDWLLGLLPEFRRRHDARLFNDEIRFLVTEATNVVDLPANRTVVPVGPCPEDPDGRPCPGQVKAIIPHIGSVTRPKLACKTCGMEWLPEQWLRVGKRIMHRMGTAQTFDEKAVSELMSRIGA